MTYCYRCRVCGAALESAHHGTTGPLHCGEYAVRDWKAEAVSIGPNVLVSRRSLTSGEDPALYR